MGSRGEVGGGGRRAAKHTCGECSLVAVRSVANLHVNKTINSQCARFNAKNKIRTRAAATTTTSITTIRTEAINRK